MYLASAICKSFAAQNITYRSMHLLKNSSLINGEWVGALSGKTFDVLNPADNSVIAAVPDMNAEDTQKAIQAATAAFDSWQNVTAKDRSILLRKWYDLLVKNQNEIASIMTSESGKPIKESIGEVTYGNSFIEWFSEEARRINGEIVSSPQSTKQIFLTRQPIGPVALITPWNFPHAMIARKAGASLAAGCTCVIKPAEDTPLTALAMAYLAEEAGIPKGVINVVTSDRKHAPEIGKLLCQSPSIAGVSFTGSTGVGKILYQQCADGIKRIALELGGNAPFIVFKNADLNKAVQGAMVSKFRNCGQTCVSANRFLIQEDVFDKFVKLICEAIKKTLVVGNGKDENVTIGPLINNNQMKLVKGHVDDAISKGAKVEIGGKPSEKHGDKFFEPTVLTNLNKDMSVYNNEIFGPVVACIKFKDEKEALEIANSTRSGLASYFYTDDVAQIFRVSKQLEFGMVGVNEGLISTTEAAFGGIKESGIGREGSSHGIDDFVYIKYVCLGNL